MTASIRNPHVKMLCELARDDESTLRFPLPDSIFGFHAQQSCEKLLKALIAANGAAYDFTHNLERLTDTVIGYGETLPIFPFDLLNLQPFAVGFRYDFGDPLPEADRLAIREGVEMLRLFVLRRIQALQEQS